MRADGAIGTRRAPRIDLRAPPGGASTAPARRLSQVNELGSVQAGDDADQAARFGSETPAPARRLSQVNELGCSAQLDDDTDQTARVGSETSAPARRLSDGALWSDAAQLYSMQFTTTAEHAELVERARALLSHSAGKVSLGELHLQAMRLLVKSLEKRRFGSEEGLAPQSEAAVTEIPRERRQRGRYIPARLRRAVYERDQGRCAYVDERGVRCGEAHRLEVHHLRAFALGGVHELQNLSLRCKAHNTLAAEQDFGREYVAHQRERSRHKPERDAKGR